MRPSSPASTWAAVLGLIRPDGLADGAAIGWSAWRNRAVTAAPAGTRIASVGRPAAASGQTRLSCRRGSTSVSGPGQNASARRRASGDASTSRNAASASGTCTINGLLRGRRLAAKMAATAAGSVASAPSP